MMPSEPERYSCEDVSAIGMSRSHRGGSRIKRSLADAACSRHVGAVLASSSNWVADATSAHTVAATEMTQGRLDNERIQKAP